MMGFDFMGDPKVEREAGQFLSFEDVQGRLVEAMCCAWRMPDRERGWTKLKSLWPTVRRHSWFGDYPDVDATPRPLPLSRKEIADMEQAFAWVQAVEGDDRRLIGLAISKLAAGHARVPWRELLAPMGVNFGADGLRKRYSRAMVKVVGRANGGKPGVTLSRG